MNITPKDGPSILSPRTSQASSPASARERAVARLLESPAATPVAPVPNPTSVSPEEVGAVKAQSRQNDTVESPAPESTSAEPKATEEPLSSQYAILARKEKQYRQQVQQLKAREAAIKAQEDALRAPTSVAFDESKYVSRDKLASDPFSVLSELGLSYDQLTDMALNAPKPENLAITNEIKALREELKTLKGETENTKKSFEEQQTQSYQQALNQIRNEAKSLVEHDPNFETVKETGSVGDVVDLIEQTFKKDGVLLTVEEAAQQVEDYLIEEAMKIIKIKKIQQRMQPKAEAAPVAQETAQPKQQQLKTLTNSVGSSRQLSARERALLAFENKLNK